MAAIRWFGFLKCEFSNTLYGLQSILHHVVKFHGDWLVKQEAFEKCWPIHHCELPHAHSADVTSGTVARHLCIDVDDNDDDDNDNA